MYLEYPKSSHSDVGCTVDCNSVYSTEDSGLIMSETSTCSASVGKGASQSIPNRVADSYI